MVDTEVLNSEDIGKTLPRYTQPDVWSTTNAYINTYQSLYTVAENNVTTSSFNSLQVIQTFAIIVTLAAIITNGCVLFVMIYYNQVTNKTTNTFIFNQSILDLIASLGLLVATLPRVIGITSRSYTNLIAKWLFCLIFETGVLFIAPIFASLTSIAVITIERYFKIVHPISHRNHFHPWMTKVGVVLPWIMGAVVYLIPAWSTTKIIDGWCAPLQFPSSQMFTAFSVVPFVYLFVFPLVTFMFCYGRIIYVIRRQSQVDVTVGQRNTGGETSMSSTAAGGSSDPKGQGHKNNKVSQSQKKIIKTIMMTTITYLVCWLPTAFYQTAVNLNILQYQDNIIFGLAALAYLDVFLNPVIYAAHFDVMKKLFNLVLQMFNIVH